MSWQWLIPGWFAGAIVTLLIIHRLESRLEVPHEERVSVNMSGAILCAWPLMLAFEAWIWWDARRILR